MGALQTVGSSSAKRFAGPGSWQQGCTSQPGESCGSDSSCSEGQSKLLFSLEKSQVV